jgi:crotonobetainyl-CoA:carnitine CoA-transferase CaiB-like acyl-CoA transferase
MGEPEQLQDPDLDGFIQRMVNRDKIEPLIGRFFEKWNKQDAAREAQARGIAAVPVLEPSEVLARSASFGGFRLLRARRSAHGTHRARSRARRARR